MKVLLKTNAWVLFLILIAPSVIGSFVSDDVWVILLSLTGYFMEFCYYFVVFEFCNEKVKSRPMDFYLSLLALVIFIIAAHIILSFQDEPSMISSALITLIGLVLSVFVFYRLASTYIGYTQGERHLDLRNYVIHAVLFGMLPLGIFIVHPRLQKAATTEMLRNYRRTTTDE